MSFNYFSYECCLCFSCANHSGFLCDTCQLLLQPAQQHYFLHSSIDHIFCSYQYRPPLSHWIKALKDRQQFKCLSRLLWLMQQRPAPTTNIDCIAYIPSDFRKLAQRGFNPAELIARSLANQLNIAINHHCLIKRQGQDQRGLKRWQRHKNMEKSLISGQQDLSEQHVMLIEDVLTTGATVTAAAKALKQQGAKEISVWALAHTPFKQD